MAEPVDIEARVREQAEEIASLRTQIAELQASENELKAQLTAYLSGTNQAGDDALVPFLAQVAEVKAEQQALADSQAALLKSMEDEFSEFRQTLREELSALRDALGSPAKPAETAKTVPTTETAAPAPPPEPAPAPPEPEPAPAPEPEPAHAPEIGEIQAAPTNPLDGILAALGRRLGGNPAARGGVVTTASGCLDATRFAPENAADVAASANFVSQNQANSWLRYDFKNRKVALTHYTLRSRSDGFQGSNNPRDWVVEVSDDGTNWVVVDAQARNGDLNGKGAVKTFPVSADCPESRYVRLRQTGPAHSGKNFLAICGFELFGSLTG